MGLVAVPDGAGGGNGVVGAGRGDRAEDSEGPAGEVRALSLDAAGHELVDQPREVVLGYRAVLVHCNAVSHPPPRTCGSSRGCSSPAGGAEVVLRSRVRQKQSTMGVRGKGGDARFETRRLLTYVPAGVGRHALRPLTPAHPCSRGRVSCAPGPGCGPGAGLRDLQPWRRCTYRPCLDLGCEPVCFCVFVRGAVWRCS